MLMVSLAFAVWPIFATASFKRTWPFLMMVSSALRDPRPAAAISFCSRSAVSTSVSAGGLLAERSVFLWGLLDGLRRFILGSICIVHLVLSTAGVPDIAFNGSLVSA